MSALASRLQAALGASAVPATAPGAPLVVAPDSTLLAAEALRFAFRERLRVLPAGARAQAPGAAGCDFVLTTIRMHAILEHVPADLVAVVETGIPLATLDAHLATHQQRLAPDPSLLGGGTIGGAVAANRCGPSRRARGTWRDAVLGARVVHADGRVSRSGGRVVKNVAGFDLAKLWIGSHGALVWIADVALRLVPRARAARTLVQRTAIDTAFERARALHRAPLTPQAILVVRGEMAPGWGAQDAGLVLRFEGHPDAVAAQVQTATAVAGAWEDAPDSAWARVQACLDPAPGARALRLFGLPTAGRAWLDALDAASASTVVVQFGVGIADARLTAGCDAAALAAQLAARGVRWSWAAGAGPPAAPATGLDPVAQELARATKAALDPHGIFPERGEWEAAT